MVMMMMMIVKTHNQRGDTAALVLLQDLLLEEMGNQFHAFPPLEDYFGGGGNIPLCRLMQIALVSGISDIGLNINTEATLFNSHKLLCFFSTY